MFIDKLCIGIFASLFSLNRGGGENNYSFMNLLILDVYEWVFIFDINGYG